MVIRLPLVVVHVILVFAAVAAGQSADPAAAAFTGQVLSHDGTPLSSATVALIESDTFDSRITRYAQTGPDGRFSIEPARYSPLAADAWKSFLIEAPDHGPIGVRIRLGRPVTVQLPAKTSARIRLIGPDGQAASHVEFTVDSISALDDRQWSIPLPERFRNARKGKTDSDGMATIGNLSVGTVVSLRILDDRFTQPASTDRFEVDSRSAHRTRLIRLRAAASVTGTITTELKNFDFKRIRVLAQEESAPGAVGRIFPGKIDAEGNFQIQQISRGRYNIIVDTVEPDPERPWAAIAIPGVELDENIHLEEQTIAIVPTVEVTGRVVSGGAGLGGIVVGARGPEFPPTGQWARTTRTNADGRFTLQLPPGDNRFNLVGQPPAPYLAPRNDMQVTLPRNPADLVNISLEQDQTLALGGQILTDAGVPVSGATVSIELRPDGKAPAAGSARQVRSVLTGSDGSFRVPAVPKWSLLRVRSADGKLATEKPMPVAGTDKPIVVRVQETTRRPLRVEVYNESAMPVADALVTLADLSGAEGAGPGVVARRTASDGSVEFQDLFSGGDYHLSVDHPGYARIDPADISGRDLPPIVRLTLSYAESYVEGRVIDRGEEGIPYATVRVTGIRTPEQILTTDQAGYFRSEFVARNDTLQITYLHGDLPVASTAAKAGSQSTVMTDPKRGTPRKKRQ